MSRETAIIKKQNVKKTEKAIMLPKVIMLGEFSFHATVFVPKADLKKHKPKIALTLDVNGERPRFVADSVEDLIKSFAEIILLLEQNKENIELAVLLESDMWLKKQEAEQDRLNIERKNRTQKYKN